MNEIVNRFLLAGDKFMNEMHLKQPRITYSAHGSFTKIKERTKKFNETGDTSYIYKNELHKACIQHDMAYGDFKGLARRADFDEVLRDKAFNIAKTPKYDVYERGLPSIVYKLFDKKTAIAGINIDENKSTFDNEKLAEELHKPILENLKKGQFIQDLQIISGVLI